MTPEQREELKTAAQRLHDARNAPQHIFNARKDEYRDLAPSFAILSLIAQVEALTAGLDKIIEMNRFTAEHQYGNAEKAESWSCVTVARDALKGIHPTIPAIPGTKEGA